MSICAVINCDSKIKNSGIIHQMFPSNPEILKYLLELCPVGYVGKDSSRLCSKHFEINSIFPTPKRRGKKLVQNAKPNCIQQLELKEVDVHRREFHKPIVQDHRYAGNLVAENSVDEFSSNNPSNSTQIEAEVDFPMHAAAAEDFFHDGFSKYSDCSSELQLDMNPEDSDDNEHDKQS
ncbi:hypothetical protein OUZ56_025487 [Daphnia magna]|uniref:THAP-type domain-containing protein n=1 Tax=Daphnia magna TaxID=35525 RepID=A0ABQ9ZKL6_9CRUS|nr:hypothetical protein OUZ56_025487 [Daphnia magna]